jgi:CubicO group peptidase (beta-lactamase class C family)
MSQNRISRSLLVFAVMSTSLLVCSTSSTEELDTQLASWMDDFAKQNHFSGSVLVAKDGKVLFTKGYGFANVEHEIPNTPETKFRLGSITKQFTSAAVLILQERGKLKIDDPISKYLGETPPAWEKVTVHHLLTHTSGIPSYTDDLSYSLLMSKYETVSSMIDRFREKPLEFEPGSKFHYDNSGYFLLGAIIEKVSEKTYEAFLRESIFDPLEMKDSGYDRFATVLPKRAAGYRRDGDKLLNAQYLEMTQPFSAGALYSTVLDMHKWDQALQAQSGKLLSEKSFAAMYTPVKNNYGFGWSIEEFEGHKQFSHGGGINGFATFVQRFPDDRVFVVVLSNVIPSNPAKASHGLARIVLGKE